MATRKKQPEPGKVREPEAAAAATGKVITLSELMSQKEQWVRFRQWVVGTSPLICHAWSPKAKQEMLAKMVGGLKLSKEPRDPDREFAESLYELQEGQFGFPVTAIKKGIIGMAHKDRGITKESVKMGLWLDFTMVKARPAKAGALSDMPIVRLHGSEPVQREDMVRIKGRSGSTANFAYRAQFTIWAIRLTGKIEISLVPPEALKWLLGGAGTGSGIGDWRNEKGGVFGAYRLADLKEAEAWEKFAAGKGPLPKPADPDQLMAVAV